MDIYILSRSLLPRDDSDLPKWGGGEDLADVGAIDWASKWSCGYQGAKGT